MKNTGSFYNKKGQLTGYGFSCGYVEKYSNMQFWCELYKESNCYHVRKGNANEGFSIWDTFDGLFMARKRYAELKAECKKGFPLMYQGYIIKLCENGCLSAYSFKTDYFINPLYKTWDKLKLVIDAAK